MNVQNLLAELNRGNSSKFHRVVNKYANSTTKNIEKYKGKTDPELLRLSQEYAKDVFGWKGYAPWLHLNSTVAGEFKEGWIPANYYYEIVVPKIEGRHGKVSNIKTLTNKYSKKTFFLI